MSWNKIECDMCHEEVTPKSVIRSNKKDHTVQKYSICPKCTFPITLPLSANQTETTHREIAGMTKRSKIQYPAGRHISNVKVYRYDGQEHFSKQVELVNQMATI